MVRVLSRELFTPQLSISSTCIENPESMVKEKIPPEYESYSYVFSKARATGLHPHRPYDCAIDLLPGTDTATESNIPNITRPLSTGATTHSTYIHKTGLEKCLQSLCD